MVQFLDLVKEAAELAFFICAKTKERKQQLAALHRIDTLVDLALDVEFYLSAEIFVSNRIHDLVHKVADRRQQRWLDLVVGNDDEQVADRRVPKDLAPDVGVCVN